MPDVQLNAKSIVTTSATTAPAAGTSENWTVTALASGIRTLATGETYALVDATAGASGSQQAEIVRVTAATAGGTSITVTRGAEGTTPVAHAATSTFNIVLVAGSIRKMSYPDYAAPDATATYALKNEYDVLRGIYNYKSSNTRIQEQGQSRAQLPNGGMSTELVIGDSVSAGAIAQSGAAWLFDRLRAWPMAMRDAMAVMGCPSNGTDFIRHVDGTVGLDPRWVVNAGTWTGDTGYTHTTSLNAAVTLTPDRDGTIFDYWFFDSGLGTFTIAVDGTTVKTVTANGSAGWKVAHCTGLNIIANITQIKITLTVLNGGGLYSAGGSVWTPNGGLRVLNPSQSGSTASGTGLAAWSDFTAGTGLGSIYKDVAGRRRQVTDAASTSGSSTLTSATGAFTSDDIGKSIDQVPSSSGPMFAGECYIGAILSGTTATIYSGVGVNAAPVLASNTTSAQTVTIGRDPACVHIALGANDISGLAASDATITTAITNIRNQFPNSDCILHLPHEVSTSLISSARAKTYQQAMYKLADDLDVPLYDWRDRVGTYAAGQANGSYGDHLAHLTPATEADLGSQLGVARGGGSGRPQSATPPVRDTDLVNKAYIDRRKAKAAGVTATTTAESVVLRLPVPAGSLSVADTFRINLWMKPAATTVTTTRVRVGTTGTISDAAVIVMCATAATSANARQVDGQVSVATVGGSATIIGGATETVAANTTAIGTAAAATSSFNSAVVNYVTVTVQNTSSTTTTVYSGSLEWM